MPDSPKTQPFTAFVGKGELHGKPWHRTEDGAIEAELTAPGHPARYEADDGLVAAVNTALMLDKPLLLTGSPGTGKSELAERIAWEFQLGPVLRFEAQSLSEAADLFYRYDLVGRMAASRLFTEVRKRESDEESRGALRLDKPGPLPLRAPAPELTEVERDPTHPVHFVELGPLGKAILLAGARVEHEGEIEQMTWFEHLRRNATRAAAGQERPRRSVVLIDEIDKASRDFPNDLLNGIDRMEFRITQLERLLVKAPPKAQGLHPIVIITSNLERDLPPPFLRRCAFYHVPDPDRDRLARIVRLRVFADDRDLGHHELPPFYADLLDCFVAFRKDQGGRQTYEPGTTELMDAARVLRRLEVPEKAAFAEHRDRVLSALSALTKQQDDAGRLKDFVLAWKAAPRSPA